MVRTPGLLCREVRVGSLVRKLRSHMPGDSGKKEKTGDPGDKGMKGPQGPGAPRVMAETRVKREEESSKHG